MHTRVRSTVIRIGLFTTVGITACEGRQASDSATDSSTAAATATPESGGMQGMPGMQGTGGMQGGMAGMMGQMQSHMRMMETPNGDSLKAMLPMHRQMTANMLSEMNREMRGMNMSGDAAWTATMDSVRRDLVNLPEMSGTELTTFMPAHHRRVMRLMEAHTAMMKDMKM